MYTSQNIYLNLPLSAIDCYDSHKGLIPSACKRIASILHWSELYNNRNLAQYYVEWVHHNDINCANQSSARNSDIFLTVKKIPKSNLGQLNSREIAFFVVAFKDKASRTLLPQIISNYKKLKEYNVDIETYIKAIQEHYASNKQASDLSTIINNLKTTSITGQSAFERTLASIIKVTQEDYIFEPACSIYGYLYGLFPIIEMVLTALTASLLFTNFWSMFLVLSLAELSVTVIGGLISGVWNRKENGIILGALEGLREKWNQKVSNDNSFHPIVDAAFVGLYITCSWALINRLEKAAKVGSLLYILAQWGISNFALKYSAMNFFFTLKAQLLQGKIDGSILIKNTLIGTIRGLIRNALLKHLIDPIQWPIALSLQKYPSFLSQVYLQEWWIHQIFAKTHFAFTPLWLLKDNTEKLILFLSIVKEIVEINITNLSKSKAMLVMAVLWPLIQKAIFYPYSVLTLIFASFIIYNSETLKSFFL